MVYLVGAGPGDPRLATVRAVELIAAADVIVYDALANPSLLAAARPDALLIDAGKRAKAHKLSQDETNALLAEHAMAGRTVVRLKGGDPYVFGRGGEEAIYLYERGVPCEVVPGVTAAIAAPAAAGIPVTHRQIATTVTFITGHEDPTKGESQVDYAALAALAKQGGTLCFYMGMGRLGEIVECLTRHGLEARTPAAIVQWGTLPDQRSLRSTLHRIAADAEAAQLGAPAIIVVGPVVDAHPEAMRWFERRPLFGRTIAVTRTRHQASDLSRRLEELGAKVIEAPTIDLVPPADWSAIDQAVRRVGEYDWLVLTSVNGVSALAERLEAMGLDARHLAGVKVAAIGEATADALGRMGVRADLVPTQFVAESLAADLIAREPIRGRRVLLLRADIARPALPRMLTEAGAEVVDLPVYRTVQAAQLPDALREAVEQGRVDWITFTSSSTVRHFFELLGEDRAKLGGVRIASIGPITTATLRELDVPVSAEAATYNIEGLVEALCAASALT